METPKKLETPEKLETTTPPLPKNWRPPEKLETPPEKLETPPKIWRSPGTRPPPPRGQTDTCELITLAQLHCSR